VISTAEGMKEAAAYYRSKGFNGHVTSLGFLPWLLAPPGIALTFFVSTNPYGIIDAASKVSRKIFAEAAARARSDASATLPTFIVDFVNVLSATDENEISHQVVKILQSIFAAACLVHVIHAILVFRLAWSRNLAAGAWAFQALALGFPSTAAFCRVARINVTDVEVMVMSLMGFVFVAGGVFVII
jgi:hypothetical protein